MRDGAPRVAVVGGGIAGLGAAWRLLRIAEETRAPIRVTVLEAAARLGGKVFTRREKWLVVEAGPDSFLAGKPVMRAWVEALGLAGDLRGMGPRRHAYVVRDGALHRLPAGLRGIVPASYAGLFRSTLFRDGERRRVLLDRALPRRPGPPVEEASLGELVRLHFGDAWAAYLAEPLLAGIHAAALDRLSARAVQPELLRWHAEGSWIAAARRAARASRRTGGVQPRDAGAGPADAAPSSPFLTLRAGLYQAVEAAAGALSASGARLLTNATVARLREGPGGTYRVELADGSAEVADAVVLATPAFVSARLLEGVAPDAADALDGIPYVSTAAVALAFDRSDVPGELDGTGFLVPRGERRTISACTWLSSKWPHAAPPDTALLRAFVGRRDDEEALALDDDALVLAVRRDLRDLMGIAAAPRWQAVFRWPRALPQYDVGHLDRVSAAEAALAGRPGLALAGAAYRGLGLPDVLAQGQGAADRVAEHLRRAAVVRR